MTWGYLAMHGIGLLLKLIAIGVYIWIIMKFGTEIVVPILIANTLAFTSNAFTNSASRFRQ